VQAEEQGSKLTNEEPRGLRIVLTSVTGEVTGSTRKAAEAGARAGGRLLDPVPLSRAELDAANAHNLAAAAYFQQLFELISVSERAQGAVGSPHATGLHPANTHHCLQRSRRWINP